MKPARSGLGPEVRAILWMFLTTRIALTLIGVVSRLALEPVHSKRAKWVFSSHLPLDLWGVWDSGIYLNIAQHGYSDPANLPERPNYPFFPLYPILIRALGALIGDPYLAGLALSNLCLLGAAGLLYRLVLADADVQTARTSVYYLMLFPTGFIFSGLFTESLFLLLLLTCFCCQREGRWLGLGIAGFLMGLTRVAAVFALAALVVEHLQRHGIRSREKLPGLLSLAAIPAGCGLFMLYCWHRIGDPLAFARVQSKFGREPANPIGVLADAIQSGDVNLVFSAAFGVACLLILVASVRRLRPAYVLFGVLSFLVPLCSGSVVSLPRYMMVVFPIPILLAQAAARWRAEAPVSAALALLQGGLMVFWCSGFNLVI